MSESIKLPSLNLFTGDWRKDPQLRVCSLAARGLWIDLLCIMQDAPRRGYLEIVANEPMEVRIMCKLIGDTEKEISEALRDLERNGVLSKDERGTIFSRRMVRDEEKRQYDIENGKLGAKFGKFGGRPRKTESQEPAQDSKPETIAPTHQKIKPCDTPLEQLKEYGASIGLTNSDCEDFKNHYDANGWVQGNRGKPVVNWKAAMNNWKKNKEKFSTNGHGAKPATTSEQQRQIDEYNEGVRKNLGL